MVYRGKQGLVVLVNQYHDALACLRVGLAYDILKSLPGLVKRRQRAILTLQGREKGVKLLIERCLRLVFPHVEVEMEYEVFGPVFLKLLNGKPLEQFLFAGEIRLQGGEEQALAEPARTAKEIISPLIDQTVYQRGLVHVDVTVVAEALKVLYAYGIFHLCVSFSFSASKIRRNRHSSKLDSGKMEK